MRNKFYPALSLFCILLLCGLAGKAQKPQKTTAKPTYATYKRPPIKSWLGTTTGEVMLPAATAGQVITLPLKVTDDKNAEYAITSYQFAYKRIGVTEDEETGKTTPQKDVTANRFTITPLPPVWQKNVSEDLHTGEELYFFDIIVLDKSGHRFFAPDLKITIQ